MMRPLHERAKYLAASPCGWLTGPASQRLQVSPMVQRLASSQTLTLKYSIRLVADIAPPPPKPRGGRTALARGDFFGSEAQDLLSRLMMLAVLRSVFTSETISSSPRATSMAFRVLPEPEQTSAAVAILSAFSSLARTSASEVLTVVSRLIA